MDQKRERMPKVNQVPHPLPLPVLGVSVNFFCEKRTGDNPNKIVHDDRGMSLLHIYSCFTWSESSDIIVPLIH